MWNYHSELSSVWVHRMEWCSLIHQRDRQSVQRSEWYQPNAKWRKILMWRVWDIQCHSSRDRIDRDQTFRRIWRGSMRHRSVCHYWGWKKFLRSLDISNYTITHVHSQGIFPLKVLSPLSEHTIPSDATQFTRLNRCC